MHALILYAREPGDLTSVLQAAKEDRPGKVCGHNPGMYAGEKSDIVIVPKKAPNNDVQAISGGAGGKAR